MADKVDKDKTPEATFVVAEKQQGGSWPIPGDEGFVHPDGTPQSVGQLAGNRQAQADRDALGAVAHGAPLGTPGPQAGRITAEKVAAASELGDKAPATGEQAREWNDKIPNQADVLARATAEQAKKDQ